MERAPFHADLAEAPAGADVFRVTARDGAQIRAAVWPGGERGHVLLFNGRTEYIEKYGRIIARLQAMGYGVATLDWRGQGLSDRPGPQGLGWVGAFSDYQQDIDAVLAAPAVAALPGPRVLIAHSMGGCIGLRAVIEGRAQADRAIFSGPMWGLALTPFMHRLARVISGLGGRIGLGRLAAPGGGGARPGVIASPFDGNLLTTDAEHYDWFRRHLAAVPALGLGAPSLHWLRLAFAEMDALARAPTPELPIMTLLGADEAIVSPAAIRARAGATEIAEIPDGRHETLMEDPAGPVGAEVWRRIEGFLAR